jgi:hypothetical protein
MGREPHVHNKSIAPAMQFCGPVTATWIFLAERLQQIFLRQLGAEVAMDMAYQGDLWRRPNL